MLKNYLKIATAVLLRRKFLTFVNLFGTVLTLIVLVVAFSIVEAVRHPVGAQQHYDRILGIHSASLIHTTRNHWWVASPGGALFASYVKPLRTPDLVSFSMKPATGSSYIDGNCGIKPSASSADRRSSVCWVPRCAATARACAASS